MKRIAIVALVCCLALFPVISVFAADEPATPDNPEATPVETVTEENPNQPEVIPVGTPDSSEMPQQSSDIFTSISRFFDMFIPLVPWVVVFSVLIIAIWVFFDASRRTQYAWIWGLASLLVIPWLVYLAWRPQLTIEEQKIYEADSGLRKVEREYYQYMLSKEKFICSVCGTPVEPDFQVCPNCFKELKKVCPSCDKLLDLEWRICPYCATRVADKPKGA